MFSKVLKFLPVTRDSELRRYILYRDFKYFLWNSSWLICCIPSSYGCTREVGRRQKKSKRQKTRKTKKDKKSVSENKKRKQKA